jgi:hypothetical protein
MDPSRTWSGWYLTGRRMTYGKGTFEVRGPLLSRRLLSSFEPGTVDASGLVVGSPMADLDTAGVPSGEYITRFPARSRRSVLPSESLRLGSDFSRYGDASTGLLYPVDYEPSGDAAWGDRPRELVKYPAGWQHVAVLWL